MVSEYEMNPRERTECPKCHTINNHVVRGWHRENNLDTRYHCCMYCGQEWRETATGYGAGTKTTITLIDTPDQPPEDGAKTDG